MLVLCAHSVQRLWFCVVGCLRGLVVGVASHVFGKSCLGVYLLTVCVCVCARHSETGARNGESEECSGV